MAQLADALTGLVMLLPLVTMSVFAFWRGHVVSFMLAGGVAVITACYTPDILNRGSTDPLSLGVGLVLIGYSLVCLAFAYMAMFRGVAES